MTDRAVSKNTVLNKISFVLYGAGTEAHEHELRSALNEHLAERGDKIVSRQTVMYWFEKGSAPSRSTAFTFLRDFLGERTNYEALSPDQKKVYKQCMEFLDLSLRSSNGGARKDQQPGGIKASGSSNILIRNNHSLSDLEEFSASWQGTYITYRLRLLPSAAEPVAREVVRIVRRNKDIVYQHWHRRDGVVVDRFEGLVSIRKNSVWMFGANREDTRYRICHFRANSMINPVHRAARWGLMHSDIPLTSSHEPASTRILMLLNLSKIENFEAFLNETVRYCDFASIDDTMREKVRRMICNDVPSMSHAGTISPTADSDSILKVDQRTLENFCNTL